MQLDVSIIVVTYNHAGHIAACLRSLLALDPSPREVIVVDNHSSDGTAELIRRDFPQVRLIEPGANLGFAAANNLAASQTTSRYLVFANPDLVAMPGWLRELIMVLETTPQAGIVGGKLLFPNGRTIQHAGGRLLLPLALGQHRGHGEADTGQYETLEPVDYVTGATLACKRELWEHLGGFDDGFYPAYYEEVDLCMRARAAGWEVLYTPRAMALHVETAGLARHSPAFYRCFHRNRLRFIFKHFDATWLLRIWLPAELAYLRSVASDEEIDALVAVYLAYQAAAYNNGAGDDPALVELPQEGTGTGGETELQWVARQLREKATLVHTPAGSRWRPLARLRRRLSRLLIADELRPILQQQTNANTAAAEAVEALVRQRRAADAAVVLQGMVLARLWAERNGSHC